MGCSAVNCDIEGAVERLMKMIEEHNRLAEEYEMIYTVQKSSIINLKSLRRQINAAFKNFR